MIKSLFTKASATCVVLFLLLWIVTRVLPIVPFAGWVLVSLISGVLLSLWMIYIRIIVKTQRTLTLNTKGGCISFFNNGRLLLYIISLCVAIPSAFYTLFLLSCIPNEAWLYLLPILPIYGICRTIIAKMLRHESAEWMQAARLGNWTILSTSIITLLVYFSLNIILGTPYSPDSVDAIRAAAINPFPIQSAPFLHELGNWVNLLESYKKYILQLCDNTYIIAGFAAFTQLIIFGSISTCFSIATLPKGEFKRIFANLSIEPAGLSIKKRFVSLFLLLGLIITALYGWGVQRAASQGCPELSQWRIRVQVIGDKTVIQVRDEIFTRDFEPLLRDWNKRKLALHEQFSERLKGQEATLNQEIEVRVDQYLDWHYGLGAEYARTASLVSDTAESYIKNKYQELIFKPLDFSGMEHVLKEYHAEIQMLNKEMDALKKNYLVSDPSGAEVRLLDQGLTTTIEDRLVASSISGLAAGSLAGVLTSKVTKKLFQKAIGKLVIKQLVKAGASKAVAASSGAAVGGAIGSTVPLVGTAIGIAVGAGVGLAADYLMLKGDEYFNREEYRQELLNIIHETISEQFKLDL